MARLRRLPLPWIALIVGLLATLAAALLMARAEEDRRRARFSGLVESSVGAVRSRMLVQLTLLRGAAGFLNASDRVTRTDFKAYIDRLRLQLNYPGVLGIGYSAYARDRDALERLVADAPGLGVPRLLHRPGGERPDYSAILFLEPQGSANAQVIGFDMLSEERRREAMEAAAQTQKSQLSGRIQLVQDAGRGPQPGFLIYTPIFTENLSSRQLRGWIYSPLRAQDLFGAVFGNVDLSEITVEVFDERLSEADLLYRTARPDRASPYTNVSPIELAGRRWLIRVTASPRFTQDTILPAPLGVAIAGTLISLLLAAVMLVQGRATHRTEQEVKLRTAELRAANEQLRAEADARKVAEAKVAHMQKVEAIGQLTGGIAHDFNNMLTVVIGNLDIARRRIGDPDRANHAIAQAAEGASKAADLTQRLLAFGRQQALRPQVLDVSELIGGMSDMLRRTLGEAVRLETTLPPSLWPVCADRAQLESAILNLAINARDAMDEAGVLTIKSSNVTLSDGDLPQTESQAVGPHVLIVVADTGQGMSQEISARALDPFFTTKPVGKGTGLGLSQVYGFVRQSGGHLTIDSVMGVGTKISIYLPRHRGDHVALSPTVEASSYPSGAGETILVVEDEDQVRDVSVETLREIGYEVLVAASGHEGLQLLDRHPQTRLIFTDVVMPEMDGRTFAARVRDRWPDMPILFTTGYARGAEASGDPLDAEVMIRKPFAIADLAVSIRRMLDQTDK